MKLLSAFLVRRIVPGGAPGGAEGEIAAGFTEMRAWKDRGVRPHAGLHPETVAAGSSQSNGADR
jgi:hypothetical protein